MSNSDSPNMWKVIHCLNCTPDANSPNEAVSHKGRTITDIKSKANVFINHYARVSELNMSQSQCDTKQQFKKRLNAPSFDDESCAPFLMGELQSAIKKMRGKGAAGPDNIPPSFLNSLSLLALQELLSIFNSSFSLAHCPRIWRVATIIPLCKAGKSPCEVVSFHPISLMSCVMKLLERILADHLYLLVKPTKYLVDSKLVFIKDRAVKIRLLEWSSNWRWLPTVLDETLCIYTSWLQQSIWYSLERKTTATHAKHWHSSNIHPLDLIFPQRLQGTCSTLQRL